MKNSKKVYPAKLQRSRGFVIPLIIAIVAILAVGGIYYTYNWGGSMCWPYCKGMTDQDRELIKQSAIDAGATTTDVTAGWKTYTNTQYGFEFKYPESWEVEDKLWQPGNAPIKRFVIHKRNCKKH